MNVKKLKFWIGAMCCSICMLTGILHLNLTNSDIVDNVLVLHNAEALAQGEGGDGGCYGPGSVVCGSATYYGAWNW